MWEKNSLSNEEYHNFVANSKLLINAELNGIEWKISK